MNKFLQVLCDNFNVRFYIYTKYIYIDFSRYFFVNIDEKIVNDQDTIDDIW